MRTRLSFVAAALPFAPHIEFATMMSPVMARSFVLRVEAQAVTPKASVTSATKMILIGTTLPETRNVRCAVWARGGSPARSSLFENKTLLLGGKVRTLRSYHRKNPHRESHEGRGRARIGHDAAR